MSNDISPITPAATAPKMTNTISEVEDGKKKNQVNHEEFGNETEMDDLRKPTDEQRIDVTPEDDRRLRSKVDKRILLILCWVYFLQILDKTVFGYGNVFGMSRDTNLADGQYSQVSIMNAIAQIAWQPFSSYLIVKVPSRVLMTVLVFCWGASQTGMAGAQSYGGLVATRFLLGLFEAGCLPLFGVITAQWYRRSEQPIRVAAWYSTNGIATMFSAIIAYGLGHSTGLAPWRALFLTAGLMTILTAPVIWLVHDSSIDTARFYTPKEKEQATERLRANQTGTGSSEFKWHQVLELFYDTKTYLWLAMSLLLNVGAAVTNIFGPTLIGNFGFDDYTTCLLNIPFGFLQFVWILVSSWAVHHIRLKSAILAAFMIPVVVGLALLYSEATGAFRQGPSLAGYYLLSFLFGGNPLIVSWIAANTGGQTKKTAIFSLYNAGVAIGNIIGPLLFKDSDSPRYVPGLRGVLAIFIALVAVIGLQVVNLFFLNKMRQKQRVNHGKPKYINDTSMSKNYVAYGADQQEGQVRLGQNALLDLTDYKNDEFVYLY